METIKFQPCPLRIGWALAKSMVTYFTPLNHCLAVKKKILLIAMLSEENFAYSLLSEENFAISKKSGND